MLAASRLYRRTTASFTHLRLSTPARRNASTQSPMREWYSTILPSMFPIALLASAVYTTLLLAQLHLSHEKTMEEQAARLVQLEAEVDALHRARKSTA
ncbi:hypothetical protein R3P38DRAFT_2830276 [Favolaschia claudopus]|uniref:Uncharacterized protein n=1 Tax=Favolaschia claudopus TaxID=2862362 RepID=A0AAW0EBH1_9AGAR